MKFALIFTSMVVVLLALGAAYVLPTFEAKEAPQAYRYARGNKLAGEAVAAGASS